MRSWVEKLGKKLKNEGVCRNGRTCYLDKAFDLLENETYKEYRLFVYIDGTYVMSIKLYEEEHDYLDSIFKEVFETWKERLIEEFESYE